MNILILLYCNQTVQNTHTHDFIDLFQNHHKRNNSLPSRSSECVSSCTSSTYKCSRESLWTQPLSPNLLANETHSGSNLQRYLQGNEGLGSLGMWIKYGSARWFRSGRFQKILIAPHSSAATSLNMIENRFIYFFWKMWLLWLLSCLA